MTYYFYDDVAAKLIAYDDEAGTARELRSVQIGAVAPATFTDSQPVPTKVEGGGRTKTPKTAKAAHTGNGCPECGSPSRHKKDCSRAGASKPKADHKGHDELSDPSARRTAAMPRMTFGRVKIAHSHDIPPKTIANNLDLTEEDVNNAIEAETYDDYLKL